MMVELSTRMREMTDEDEGDMEDMSSYEKSGVRLAWLGLEEAWLGLEDLYQCNYPPDEDSYLQYWGWSIDSHMKFSQVPVSHDDFPHLLWSLSFMCSTLPLPKNTKLIHPFLCLHAKIMS